MIPHAAPHARGTINRARNIRKPNPTQVSKDRAAATKERKKERGPGLLLMNMGEGMAVPLPPMRSKAERQVDETRVKLKSKLIMPVTAEKDISWFTSIGLCVVCLAGWWCLFA